MAELGLELLLLRTSYFFLIFSTWNPTQHCQSKTSPNQYRLLSHFVADPDPACHFDADSVPGSVPDPFHFDADPDPSFQIKAQNLEKVRK